LIAEFETAFGLYHRNMSCHPKSGERPCLLILFVTKQWESAQVFKLFGFQDIEEETAPPRRRRPAGSEEEIPNQCGRVPDRWQQNLPGIHGNLGIARDTIPKIFQDSFIREWNKMTNQWTGKRRTYRTGIAGISSI